MAVPMEQFLQAQPTISPFAQAALNQASVGQATPVDLVPQTVQNQLAQDFIATSPVQQRTAGTSTLPSSAFRDLSSLSYSPIRAPQMQYQEFNNPSSYVQAALTNRRNLDYQNAFNQQMIDLNQANQRAVIEQAQAEAQAKQQAALAQQQAIARGLNALPGFRAPQGLESDPTAINPLAMALAQSGIGADVLKGLVPTYAQPAMDIARAQAVQDYVQSLNPSLAQGGQVTPISPAQQQAIELAGGGRPFNQFGPQTEAYKAQEALSNANIAMGKARFQPTEQSLQAQKSQQDLVLGAQDVQAKLIDNATRDLRNKLEIQTKNASLEEKARLNVNLDKAGYLLQNTNWGNVTPAQLGQMQGYFKTLGLDINLKDIAPQSGKPVNLGTAKSPAFYEVQADGTYRKVVKAD